jgi:hypothetical protein
LIGSLKGSRNNSSSPNSARNLHSFSRHPSNYKKESIKITEIVNNSSRLELDEEVFSVEYPNPHLSTRRVEEEGVEGEEMV